MIENVINEMKNIFGDAPYWTPHTLNVYDYACQIIEGEHLIGNQAELIKLAAILHDIGVLEAQAKHYSMSGKYQEIEAAIVKKILSKHTYNEDIIERIAFIVGHHHTITAIDGIDFQILWEADALENMKEIDFEHDNEKLEKFIIKNFKTKTGTKLVRKVLI